MKCSDLSQCYFPRLVQQAWGQCSKSLRVLSSLLMNQEKQKEKENWLETWQCLAQTLSFKRLSLAKSIRKQVCLLVALAVLSLSLGCSTSSQSQSSAQSSQVLPLLPLPHQKTKNPSHLHGVLSNSQAEQMSPQQSRQDTSLWSASPLWGR